VSVQFSYFARSIRTLLDTAIDETSVRRADLIVLTSVAVSSTLRPFDASLASLLFVNELCNIGLINSDRGVTVIGDTEA